MTSTAGPGVDLMTAQGLTNKPQLQSQSFYQFFEGVRLETTALHTTSQLGWATATDYPTRCVFLCMYGKVSTSPSYIAFHYAMFFIIVIPNPLQNFPLLSHKKLPYGYSSYFGRSSVRSLSIHFSSTMHLLIDSKVAHFNAYVVLRVWLAAKCVSVTKLLSLYGCRCTGPCSDQPTRSLYVEAIKGEPVVLTVEAQGEGTLRYKWFKGAQELQYCSGTVLRVESATSLDSGQYCCTVSNDYCSVLSDVILVKVVLQRTIPPPITHSSESKINVLRYSC